MSRDRSARHSPTHARGLRALLRGGAIAGVGAVALFHGWLLLQRLVDSTIGEPAILLRWLGAVGLLAGALAVRRRGLSVTSGRSALVFWLLVLLLHVGASPVPLSDSEAPLLLLTLPWGLATGLVCAAAAYATGRRVVGRPRRLRRLLPDAPPPRCSAGAAPHRFSPRPPPLLAAV